MKSLTCPCETVFEADIPDTVNLDEKPGALADILNGTFLSASCPNCGNLVKPDLAVRVLSPGRGMDVQVIPELDRWAYYRGAIDLPKGAEAIIGYRELAERVRTLRDGLSSQVLEMIKYLLLARAEQDNPEAQIVIEYAGRKDGSLEFDVWGLKEGEAGVLRIPEELYGKMLSELPEKAAKEPFARIFAGSYRSIRVLEADSEEE